MLIKVFGLMFLFIIRLHFPRSQSIADVIRKRYGDKVLKNVRKILNTCYKCNVIPNFIRFRVTNETLKDSLSYSRCQQLLLNEEIRCKKRCLRQLIFEYDRIKQELQYQLSHACVNFVFRIK